MAKESQRIKCIINNLCKTKYVLLFLYTHYILCSVCIKINIKVIILQKNFIEITILENQLAASYKAKRYEIISVTCPKSNETSHHNWELVAADKMK